MDTTTFDESSLCRLLQLLEDLEKAEYSCEATFNLLDEYADLVVSNEEAAVLMPIVKHHLDKCVDCGDKFEVLLQILQEESTSS